MNFSCDYDDVDEYIFQLTPEDLIVPSIGHERCFECGKPFSPGELYYLEQWGDEDMQCEEDSCDDCIHIDSCDREEKTYSETKYTFIFCPQCAHDVYLAKQMGVCYTFHHCRNNLDKNIMEHLSNVQDDSEEYRKHAKFLLWKVIKPLRRRKKIYGFSAWLKTTKVNYETGEVLIKESKKTED